MVADRERAFDDIRELAGMGEGSGNRVCEVPMRPTVTIRRGSLPSDHPSCTFSPSETVGAESVDSVVVTRSQLRTERLVRGS